MEDDEESDTSHPATDSSDDIEEQLEQLRSLGYIR